MSRRTLVRASARASYVLAFLAALVALLGPSPDLGALACLPVDAAALVAVLAASPEGSR